MYGEQYSGRHLLSLFSQLQDLLPFVSSGRVGKTQILDRVISMVTKAIAAGIVSPAGPPEIEEDLDSDEDMSRVGKRGRRRAAPIVEAVDDDDDDDHDGDEQDRIK